MWRPSTPPFLHPSSGLVKYYLPAGRQAAPFLGYTSNKLGSRSSLTLASDFPTKLILGITFEELTYISSRASMAEREMLKGLRLHVGNRV